MKPEFFCCIGGELKDTIQGIFKCSRIFLYRAAQSQTIDDMLVDGFFNNADDIRVNDLIILYCPEESRAYTFAKVSSIINGVVKTKELSTNISIFINDAGYLTADDLAEVALTGAFDDLVGVTITNPTVGQYLRWNGTQWINMDGDGGGGSGVWGAITGDIEDQADLQSALSDKADVTALAGKADIDLGNIDSDGEDVIKALAPDGNYDNTVSGLSATTLQTAIDELASTKVDKGHEVINFQAPTSLNNYTWYREYADGYVEQGGIHTGTSIYATTTITLPIPMADTNYNVQVCATNISSVWFDGIQNVLQAATTDIGGCVTNKTTTNFQTQSYSTRSWYVSGMKQQ